MAPKKKVLRKKRQLQEDSHEADGTQRAQCSTKKIKRKRTQDKAGLTTLAPEPNESSLEAGAEDASAPEPNQNAETSWEDKKNMRGVVHLATLPLCMRVQKLRHILEQFGELGRVYLAPEDKFRHQNRKRAGGNRKLRYTEGWVEFADRRIAKRVAHTLNGTTIGGKKRHNFFRDDMWNMRYLPRFKWHMLKEGTMYNQQVRKARLQQRLSQATRENTFYLEKVEQAKTQQKIAERRTAKGKAASPMAQGTKLPRTAHASSQRDTPAPTGSISERVLNSLL